MRMTERCTDCGPEAHSRRPLPAPPPGNCGHDTSPSMPKGMLCRRGRVRSGSLNDRSKAIAEKRQTQDTVLAPNVVGGVSGFLFYVYRQVKRELEEKPPP